MSTQAKILGYLVHESTDWNRALFLAIKEAKYLCPEAASITIWDMFKKDSCHGVLESRWRTDQEAVYRASWVLHQWGFEVDAHKYSAMGTRLLRDPLTASLYFLPLA